MGKRNQITTDLRISAEAQLKTSRNFISQLEKISDKFDFGEKINTQILNAQNQLKGFNKILEKMQGKSVISDDELKNIVKAGKDIANLITKTEKLYSGMSTNELQKYSKAYIAQIKAQEEAALKIKQEYQDKTGKVYDKEIKNLDKYENKIVDLQKQIKALNDSKDDSIDNAIKKENARLQEQFDLLQKVKKTQNELKNSKDNIYAESSARTGFSEKELKSKVSIERVDVTKDVANAEYKNLLNTYQAISKERDEILKATTDSSTVERALIQLAEKYHLANVQTTAEFEKQFSALEKQKNFYRLLQNRNQLATEEKITAEIERRNALLREQKRIADEIAASQAGILGDNGFESAKQMNSQARNAKEVLNGKNVQLTVDGASLTEKGEDDIATQISGAIKQNVDRLIGEEKQVREEVNDLNETNNKLATQSERAADEGDIRDAIDAGNTQENQTRGALKDSEKNINMTTINSDRSIATDIVKEFNKEEMKSAANFIGDAFDLLTNSKFDEETAGINRDLLNNQIVATLTQFEKVISNTVDNTEDFQKVTESLIGNLESMVPEFQEELIARENATHMNIGSLKKTWGKSGNEYQNMSLQDAIASEEASFKKDEEHINQTIEKIKRLISIVEKLQQTATKGSDALDLVGNSANNNATKMGRAAQQSQYLSSTFDDIKNKVGYFLSLNYIFDTMTQKIREAVQTTREMDKDMTQIGLVLGKTSTQVWKNFSTYSQMAARLNTTTSEVTQSMKLFYQQGLNTTEVNKMVEASAVAAALGESTMAEASETLTSILNSYNLNAHQAMEVTDKISQIAIVSAADFGELSTAIEKVASSAASAGLDLDHMMGYLAKMIETTREAPTNIGTALKTIVANFTQFKEDPTGLNQEGTEINKVDKALKSVGISLTDANGEVRDLGEVIDELGQQWENLTRNQKSYLATAIAGTRQQSRFYALMNDYGRTLELVAEGSNSAGKAQQQFALYSNSLEAATNRLTNQWERFFNDITRGNGLIANTTNILTTLMKVVNAIGPIGTVLGIGSLTSSLRKSINWFANFNEKVKEGESIAEDYQREFNKIANNSKLTKKEKADKKKKLTGKYNESMAENQNFFKELGADAEKYKQRLDAINISQKEWIEKIDSSNKHFKGLRKVGATTVGALKKGLSSVPIVLQQISAALVSLASQFAIMLAAQAVLKLASAGWSALKSALQVNTEAYIENAEKAQENADNIGELVDEYEQLSKKINLTSEEQERLKEITEEVTKVDASLGRQLKENANNYTANVKAMREYADLQERIAAQETAKAVKSEASMFNLKNLFALFDPDVWTAWIGDESEKNNLTSEQQNNWRELSTARGQQYGLTNEQTAMLDRYAEELIQIQEDRGWDSLTYKYNTDEFDGMIIEFIEGLSKLTTAQQESYTNFVTQMNAGNATYSELMTQWAHLDLPSEVKSSLFSQLQDILESIEKQINNNTFIKNKKTAYNNALRYMSVSDANNLFNPDTSTFSEEEKEIYKADLAKFVEDTAMLQKYQQAQLKGSDALKDFSTDLAKGGQYTQLFTQSIYATAQALSSEEFENAIANIVKLGDLNITDTLKGGSSQLDILKELGKGKIDFKDVITTEGGTMSVSNSRLIAEQEANFKLIFDKLYGILDERKAVAESLVADDNPLIADIVGQKNLATAAARQAARVTNDYSGGYEKNWKAVDKTWLGLGEKDITTEYKNMSVEDLRKIVKGTKGHFMDDGFGYQGAEESAGKTTAARMAISEKTVDLSMIRDTKNMDDTERNKYLEDTINLRNEELDKLKTLNKYSQEYYDTTYKISKLGDSINGALDDGAILESDKVKIAEEYDDKIENQKKVQQEITNELKKQIENEKTRLDIIKKRLTEPLNYEKGFAGFFDGLAIDNTTIQQLEGIKTAYSQLQEEIINTDELQQTLASNPALIQALDVTSKGLVWNKQKLEELGIAAMDESYNYIQSRIDDMEATKITLEAQSDDISQWSDEAVTQTAAVIGGNNSLVDTQQENISNEASNLGLSEQSWINWSDSVCAAIKAAGEEYNKFLESEANKTQQEYKGSYNGSAKVDETVSGKGAATVEDKKTDIAETLKATGYSADKKGAIENINTQINLLKGLQNSLKYKKSNAGSYLGGDLFGDGGGSKDEFEPVIEKLEKFYNYLRQLEELEARINRIREKRNLIDTSKTYYIDKLQQENDLLREQQSIYNNYIRDQGVYLQELQQQIQSQFGDWAYFNEDGVIQVKQTEFTANSEEEEERLNLFLELVGLYQDEYNTREENINTLYSLEHSQLENIQEMYDKVLARIQDINDALNRQADLLDHQSTMSFSNIGKFGIMDDKALVAVEGLKKSQAYLNDYEGQIKALGDEVRNGPFSELLVWDETLQVWRTNEEALNDPAIVKKYEAMGYTWQDIDTYCRSVAVKSQSIRDSWNETEDAANAFAELLKSLIDDRISLIQDLFGAATDELNKVFDTFDSKITDLDNQNDLFGTTSESLEEKYLTLVTAATVLKQTIQSLEDNRGSIIERIQKDYPEYIEMINGIAVVNKQAIEESNNLSDEQKAELLQLYGILEAADGQITEMNDKLIDYFNNMMEMEEAKREAIIEMKQAVHDELMARDQEEIDNLQVKYEKMSQLDNEYYSELQQRINDARDLRDRRQESTNIGQMQARLAVLKADNSGTYNSELIELQKQIQQALQTQADNDINRELERIQREQQQREEDRQLTISAMENVLTFKDDNNWYWQEAQRIWSEGPTSVTGFLQSSREYMNVSDEQRNKLFSDLTTSMNTAFTTLQTAAGQTAITSDGVVTNQTNFIMDDLNLIQQQLGEGSTLATKIDWSNTQNVNKLTALDSTVTGLPNTIKTNMDTLFNEKIQPGVNGVVNTITSYLGTDSAIWKKLDGMNTNLGTLTSTKYYDNLNGIVNALTGNGENSIASILKTSKTEYLKSTGDIYKWLDETYRKEHAPEPETKTEATVTPPSNTGGGSSGSNSGGGNGGGAGNSVTTAPELKVGSAITVKPGTRWYYDSYGTNPSGTARGGKIKHINLKGSHQYNIDGLGWIKKTDIVGYSKGGYVDYTGIANVHGSSTSPEAFLNAKQTRLFEALRDNLTKTASNRVYDKTDDEITKEEYNIDNINIQVQQIADVDAIDKVTKRVKEEIYKDSIGHNNMAVRRR